MVSFRDSPKPVYSTNTRKLVVRTDRKFCRTDRQNAPRHSQAVPPASLSQARRLGVRVLLCSWALDLQKPQQEGVASKKEDGSSYITTDFRDHFLQLPQSIRGISCSHKIGDHSRLGLLFGPQEPFSLHHQGVLGRRSLGFTRMLLVSNL